MKDKIIKLDENDTLKLEIVTSDGVPTGEYLEFDIEDIELPLKFQELILEEKKNRKWIENQIYIINKKQDHKGPKIMSANEEAKMKAIRDFFKKEEEIYNGFLGENGVQKLLNGRKLGWTSLSKIDKIIETQILPLLDIKMENITAKIKQKYKEAEDEEVLK